ncbi:hypothetical protein OXIME_000139 [Oxyplasma meridianum]|uniref:Mannosylglycerate hydrolase MGH1-like glycoside hydrolase domain-containing protein n=1 Tax=Oxyplasma meridianum TaxID=3073602 RepID=A0AAX4NFX5_9ARCH
MNMSETTKQLDALRSPEGWLYAGLPKFKALFGRDSIISSLELINYDSSIAVSTINALMKMQGIGFNSRTMEEPGKIIHEHQTDRELIEKRSKELPWLTVGKNYFSVDSTPLFVILISEMWRNDKHLVREDMIISMVKAVKWIIEHGMNGSFLSYRKPPVDSGLQSQSWRDGIGSILDEMKSPISIVGVQGYAYYSLKKAYEVLRGFGSEYKELIDEIQFSLRFIRDNLYEYFQIDDGTYLGLALDGDGVLNRTITSDPGHLLFSGILDGRQQNEIVKRLFEPDLLTDYGIRCMSKLDPFFDSKAYQRGSIWPHDNWMIAIGLLKNGFLKQYGDLRERILHASEILGGLPEYFGVSRGGTIIENEKMRIKPCFPQAWSTGAEIYFRKKRGS